MDNQIDNQEPVEICPNCMEPNAVGQINCAYCGMSMHAEENTESPAQEKSADASANGTPIEVENTAPAKSQPKKQNKGFTYAMRGMGLYLIVYAISEIPRSLKLEKQQDRMLSLVSNVIYLIAGAMIAWPMLKEYLDKRKKAQSENLDGDTAPVSDTKEVIEGEFVDESSADEALGETDINILNEDNADEDKGSPDPDLLDEDSPADENKPEC
ncbi:MAG: hypothetical protein GX933_00410 [Chloroflexi bacterium]|nr:hypothetical protein [Chloroflexota bacterium]